MKHGLEQIEKGLGVDTIIAEILSGMADDNPVNTLLDIADALVDNPRALTTKEMIDELVATADIIAQREKDFVHALREGLMGALPEIVAEIEYEHAEVSPYVDEYIFETAHQLVEEKLEFVEDCAMCSERIANLDERGQQHFIHENLALEEQINKLQHQVHNLEQVIVDLQIVAREAQYARSS